MTILRQGRDVTLTLPDGRRTTFTFSYQQGGLSEYQAQWSAAPGVTATLYPLDNASLIGLGQILSGNMY
ncbi:MAG: hypothetical protein C5B50_05060 [Verrucomicrobia bacterium]|nr:MAG: hypothetical protein C5B50_05060 [Verrucomicrobiota bacterium]